MFMKLAQSLILNLTKTFRNMTDMTGATEIMVNDDCEYERIKIDDAIFDPVKRTVTRAQNTIDIEPKVAELLTLFCNSKGTLSRASILTSLWGVSGSDEALTQAVSKLRRALGDIKRPYRIIKTVPTVGYLLGINTTSMQIEAFAQSPRVSITRAKVIRRIAERNSDLLKGVVIGVSLTLLAVSGYFSMNSHVIIEKEIECPADFTPQDCIALVSAVQP